MSTQARLPLEIILQIVEASMPVGRPNFVFDVASPDAQLLASWSQVCRATYEIATRFLRQHCVYINSLARLRGFLQSLEAARSYETASVPSTLPPVLPLTRVSTIYVGLNKQSTRSVHTSYLIRRLFRELGSSVRRLILDLPFRTLRGDEDFDNVRVNREMFQAVLALTNLEEFVTLGGLPTLDFWNPNFSLDEENVDFWQRWPKLRLLAGFQVTIREEYLWLNIAKTTSLEKVVLAQPFLLRQAQLNLKESICKHWKVDSGGNPALARPLEIVDVGHEWSPDLIDTTEWHRHDPAGLVKYTQMQLSTAEMQSVRTDHFLREWLIEAAKQDRL